MFINHKHKIKLIYFSNLSSIFIYFSTYYFVREINLLTTVAKNSLILIRIVNGDQQFTKFWIKGHPIFVYICIKNLLVISVKCLISMLPIEMNIFHLFIIL